MAYTPEERKKAYASMQDNLTKAAVILKNISEDEDLHVDGQLSQEQVEARSNYSTLSSLIGKFAVEAQV